MVLNQGPLSTAALARRFGQLDWLDIAVCAAVQQSHFDTLPNHPWPVSSAGTSSSVLGPRIRPQVNDLHSRSDELFQYRRRLRSRVFSPNELYSQGVGIDDIVVSQGPWTHVACHRKPPKRDRMGTRQGHHDSLVIAVDGVCWNNGTPNA